MRTRHYLIAGCVVAAATVGGITVAASSSSSPDSAAEQREEADFTRAHLGDAEVSRNAAEEAALGRHRGSVSDTHLQDEEGQGLRWEVKVDDGDTVWEVQVDAHSGRVVSDQPDE